MWFGKWGLVEQVRRRAIYDNRDGRESYLPNGVEIGNSQGLVVNEANFKLQMKMEVIITALGG